MATTGQLSQKVDEVLLLVKEKSTTPQEGVELLATALGRFLAGEVKIHYLGVESIIRDAYITSTFSELG